MQQRYKELEEAKQSRKIVVVDKLTVPTKGKAARGRQGGMVFARAGQPRRKSPSVETVAVAMDTNDLCSPCSDVCGGTEGYLW